MKSLSLISIGTLSLACALATSACSTAADPPPGAAEGGAGGAQAGMSAGGSPVTSAGSPSTGAGGSVGGSAGSSSSVAGANTSGGSTSGGSVGAGGGAAGSGAGGGSAGAAPVVDTTFVGAWDGALLQYPCGNGGTGYDCSQPASVNCKSYNKDSNPHLSVIPPAGGAASEWTMGGVAGKIYEVTFQVRGVVEVNSFKMGMRAAGDTSVQTEPRNLFQIGGTAPVEGDPTFDYNVYEMDVTPPVTGAANVYYLNSVTEAQNPHATGTPTVHKSFNINYSATIKVPGGGKVSLKVTDSNCVQIQNCGDSTNGQCAGGARTVPLDGAMPAAPAFAQPPANGGRYGQWVFFDITKVVAAQ